MGMVGSKNVEAYDQFVEDMWFYEPAEHGGCPELAYTAGKLAGETGEICEKVFKAYRDSAGVVDVDALSKELGDALFYIVKLAHLHGLSLPDVMAGNVEKLLGRKERGTLKGRGDDR